MDTESQTTETTTETTEAAAPAAAAETAAPETLDSLLAAAIAQAAEPAPEETAPEPAGDEKPEGGDKPEGEGDKPAEPAKPEPAAAAKEPRMAERLAMVATGTRKVELGLAENAARTKELEAIEARLRPDLERVERIRRAPDRPAMLEELYGADGVRELAVELFAHINGQAGGDPAKPTKPGANPLTPDQVQRMIDEGITNGLTKAEKARLAQEEADIARGKAVYAGQVKETLQAAPRKFPHCASAPPSPQAITAISDEILRQTGALPPAEKVLQTIEDHRRTRYLANVDGQTTPADKPKLQTNGNGKKPIPVRRDSTPVVPARPGTLEDEVAAAVKRLDQRQAQ